MKAKLLPLAVMVGAFLLPAIARAEASKSAPADKAAGVSGEAAKSAPAEETVSAPAQAARAAPIEEAPNADSNGPDDLRGLIQQFRDQRQDILAARQQLVERLRNATEAERNAIMEQFRVEQRERLQAERELRRQLREQLMELRRQRRRAGATAG